MEKYYKRDEWYHVFPIAFLVAFVPLIVFLKVIPLSGAAYDFWNGQKNNSDFFSYYKMVWFIISTVMCIIMYLLKIYQKGFKIRKTWLYVPAGIYFIFVFLSALLSKYPSIAQYGFTDRYEGMFVLLGYIIVLLLTINMADNNLAIKVILGALIASALIIGIIGIFQFLGYDFFQTSFGKSFILPDQYASAAKDLKFSFGKNIIYSTLYHYDYVGSYMAILAPFTLIIFILYKGKVGKILFGIIALIMMFNLVGCNSRAGLAGVVFSMLVVIVMLRKKIMQNWKICLIVLASLMVLTFGIDRGLHGKITNYVSKVIFRNYATVQDDFDNESKLPLKDIKINGNRAELITSTETLKFQYIDSKVNLYDADDKPLATTYSKNDNGKLTIEDPRYKEYNITFGKDSNGMTMLQVIKGKITLVFKLDEQINLVSNTGRIITYGPVDKWGFAGQERLASSRGYIWSRSIPLMKNTIILGHGADTFTIYFPQDDFKGKMLAYSGDMTQIVDKPHNLYLQNAINNGVIALIAMLVLFAGYIVMTIKSLFNSDFNDFKSMVSLGILAAIIAYLGAGFLNDSVVSVAPVFWVLLGIGISLNLTIKAPDKDIKVTNNIKGLKNKKIKY